MTAGVIFIENYIAGGGDKIARGLIESLPFSRLTVLSNRGNDTRILLGGVLPKHVSVDTYGLVTIAELSVYANSIGSKVVRCIARIACFAVRYPLFIFSIAYFLVRIYRSRASVFLANNGGYPGGFYCRSASIAASLIPGMKVFHIVHGMATPAERSASIPEWCIDRLIDCRSHVITVSRATARKLIEVRAFSQHPTVIYNGIPDLPRSAALVSSPAAPFRILHMGYFDQNKNQAQLIKAVALLVNEGNDNLTVCFVGADPENGLMRHCKRLALELCIDSKISFTGFLDDVVEQYVQADLFVLCSHSEGLPISIIEAMRAGKAVISTNVGGIGEQITDGVNGFLIAPNDHEQLAERIKELMSDRQALERLGRASRETYEAQFSTQKMASAYIQTLGL